jgi:hypothetical protein
LGPQLAGTGPCHALILLPPLCQQAAPASWPHRHLVAALLLLLLLGPVLLLLVLVLRYLLPLSYCLRLLPCLHPCHLLLLLLAL